MKALQIVQDCNRRMALANEIIETNYELSVVMWTEASQRKTAVIDAAMQLNNMHYTNCGSADLRLETCRN